ncbi:MAG: hypothetical protein HY053_07570 [Proteobacteria bacterium]|nr:hypothetical protein [Pseudomonadota bacterium]
MAVKIEELPLSPGRTFYVVHLAPGRKQVVEEATDGNGHSAWHHHGPVRTNAAARKLGRNAVRKGAEADQCGLA